MQKFTDFIHLSLVQRNVPELIRNLDHCRPSESFGQIHQGIRRTFWHSVKYHDFLFNVPKTSVQNAEY